MTSVLITGGAGFIGTRLGAALVREGHEVVAMDNLHPQVHDRAPSLPAGVSLAVEDVTSADAWDRVLTSRRPSAVVHLAAETGTAQSLDESTRHGSVNVVGTTQMLDAFTRHALRPDQLLLASSRAVYGEGAWTDDERIVSVGPRSTAELERGRWDPLANGAGPLRPLPSRADVTRAEPTSVYGATKLAQEHVLRAWSVAREVPLSILRLQNVFGPGQAVGNPYTGVLTLFARLARAGDEIPVYEDGKIIRDFVFIDDVVEAFVLAISSPPSRPLHRTLDIGTGERSSIWDVACTLASLAGAPQPTITGQFRLGDVRAALCDPTAAREELGWEPSRTLEEALAELLRSMG